MVNDAPKIDFVGKKCKTKCVEVFSLRVAGIRGRPELGHLTLCTCYRVRFLSDAIAAKPSKSARGARILIVKGGSLSGVF